MLFSYPGTIERYGLLQKPIEGYFADCFDEKTKCLYHHYFHQRKFYELIKVYKSSSSYLTDQEESDIRNTAQKLENGSVEEESVLEGFYTTIRNYSIEIDDRVSKIKYNISFPEGIL
ncbi:MAG: hypothetical protein JSR46_04850 [Verrucomicrobia bacterium]|nr:hypothetical protein [Verrucomicrobiota bacterium]